MGQSCNTKQSPYKVLELAQAREGGERVLEKSVGKSYLSRAGQMAHAGPLGDRSHMHRSRGN